MRFFRRRRTQVRSAPTPTVTVHTPSGHTAPGTVATGVNWRIATGALPTTPRPEKETPVPELTPRERKLYRVTTKREQRTAGQLAVRAGLAATDGSGRGVVRDLNALVKAGKLQRHKGRDRSTYTRAA